MQKLEHALNLQRQLLQFSGHTWDDQLNRIRSCAPGRAASWVNFNSDGSLEVTALPVEAGAGFELIRLRSRNGEKAHFPGERFRFYQFEVITQAVFVLSGALFVEFETGERMTLLTGDSTRIPSKTWAKLTYVNCEAMWLLIPRAATTKEILLK